MVKSPHRRSRWQSALLAGVALLIVACDQLTKWWIREQLPAGHSFFDAGFFRIVHVQNTGAAFGLLQGHSLVFTIVDFFGIGIFITFFLLLHRLSWLDRGWVRVAIALLLGGTAGNLIDRIRLGHVTDFLDFKVWPAFNVADASITVGVIILVLSIFFLAERHEHHT